MTLESKKQKTGINPEILEELISEIRTIKESRLGAGRIEAFFGRVSALLPQMLVSQIETVVEELGRQFPGEPAVKPIEKEESGENHSL